MTRLDDEVIKCANRVVGMSRDRGTEVLDFSDASIAVVEDMLAEAAAHATRLTDDALRRLSQDVGCYVLEVARRNHGGAYRWEAERNEPGLITIGPHSSIALFCWEKVLERLRGGDAHDIPSFYAGYLEALRQAKPGDHVVVL